MLFSVPETKFRRFLLSVLYSIVLLVALTALFALLEPAGAGRCLGMHTEECSIQHIFALKFGALMLLTVVTLGLPILIPAMIFFFILQHFHKRNMKVDSNTSDSIH